MNLNRKGISAKPKIIMNGDAFRPWEATKYVMIRGPNPNPRVIPMLKTDIEKPKWRPEWA